MRLNMEISLKLAITYLLKNKKRSIVTILEITIATILVTSIFLILNIYQNYMINIKKSEGNWETRFGNISYKKLYGLEKNSDITEIFVTKNLGMANLSLEGIKQCINLTAYDENAFKNLGIKLLSGRFPQNEKEIVISRNYGKQNKNVTLEIDGKKIKYKIVGIIEPTEDDIITLEENQIGAITFLNKSNLKSNDSINAYVRFKNKWHINDTSEEIANVLKFYENEYMQEQNLDLNIDLIKYYSIWDIIDERDAQIKFLVIFLISIIVITSSIIIYSIFNISIVEREKHFAVLSSLGSTKKQLCKIIVYEAIIILMISLIIGTVASMGIFKYTFYYFQTVLTNMNEALALACKNTIITVPYTKILFAFILIAITVFIAISLPIIKIFKLSILEGIKGRNYLRLKDKYKKTNYKSVDNLILNRNKKINSYKHISIVVGITISTFLFFIVRSYSININNVYSKQNSNIYNYTVEVDKEHVDDVKDRFWKTGTIKKMYSYMENSFFIQLNEDKINSSLKNVIQQNPKVKNEVFFTNITNELKCHVYAMDEENYNEFIKQIGINNIKDNECILLNYSDVKTDYYNGVYMTNYKTGDYIELYLNSKGDGTFSLTSTEDLAKFDMNKVTPYGDNQKKVKLKIASVTNQKPNSLLTYSSEIPNLCIIVKENALNNIEKYLYGISENDDTFVEEKMIIRVFANSRELLDKELEYINVDNKLSGEYMLKGFHEETNYNLQRWEITESMMCILIILCVITNIASIINIIVADFEEKKQYFYILISIGMTRKQLLKMILKEYSKYLFIALMIGILLSLGITYIIYKYKINFNDLYKFKIPYIEIITTLFIMLFILIVIMNFINRKIKKGNIANYINIKMI